MKADVPASVVVALVALPLCLGIALASGLPAEAGILTGIVGGLLVGLIQGAPLQVSGPAAGLTIVVWEIVQSQGIARLGGIVVLAGLLQVIGALSKLGRLFLKVPGMVVQGLLAGIGMLIFASQFHVMIDDKPVANGLRNLASIPSAIAKTFEMSADLPHLEAACMGVLTIVVMVLWKSKKIPAALIGVTLATVITSVLDLPIAKVELPDSITDALHAPQFAFDWPAISSALLLAAVATAETLLCAAAVDRMHDGPRADFDRELLAQGVGNTICGAIGGLPMTGVIVRSSANLQAGAKSRWSAVMHGVWLLLAVLLAAGVLRLVPVASLAGVLVFTGIKLVDLTAVAALRKLGWWHVVVYGVTVGTIVAVDLLSGVVAGLVLAIVARRKFA